MPLTLELAERGLLPDWLLRFGIRRLLAQRLHREDPGSPAERAAKEADWAAICRRSPLAIEQQAANDQHYEVPPAFYRRVLGARLKYSSCEFAGPDDWDLNAAEERALATVCERAGLADGQDILELGCGWGSLSLWMAERYPQARITAVSNSAPQRRFIEGRAAARQLHNLRIVTADLATWTGPGQAVDRVVSIECFEHLRNYEELFRRIRSWLRNDGQLFVHVFCHRDLPYPFAIDGDDDWMARHFFTGGQMPSEGLFAHFNRDLAVAQRWQLDGTHYQKTSECWLRNLDANRDAVHDGFAALHGDHAAQRQVERWRLFFLACAETFGWNQGTEWLVTHQLLKPV